MEKVIQSVIDYAIQKEEEAATFYHEMASKMARPEMKAVFEEFALEEEKHKKILMALPPERLDVFKPQKVSDLKISDYMADVDKHDPNLTYEQALVIAMKEEKAAFKLYSDLAEMVDDKGMKNLFLSLAQEEAKHKLKYEIEYDEQFLKNEV